MDLVEAIKARKSIRGFKPDPIPQSVLEELLDIGRWSPSGVNAQSWEFVVLTGEALEAVKQANVEQMDQKVEPHPDMGVPALTGAYRERQVTLGREIFRLLGIGREDRDKRVDWTKTGLRFFDAPAAILVCADKEAPDITDVFEAGLVTQTIALAALHFSLGTCIQRAAVNYPDVIRDIAGIPASKRVLVALAIGYPDMDLPVNTLRSTREEVGDITMWRSALEKPVPPPPQP
ncbi:MAG: nitroreductase [Dehalococcoidia bacterium]|jgi:nitroreductase|nr:nitroreductase [Dehalococcoidia bacterium]MDP6511259.1 nitroreductase [Dehalococcoidia bacterium]MDP6782979.1 nitroreductase [Dehalococcoidia bacterium]